MVFKHKCESPSSQRPPILGDCLQCGASIIDDGLYCGKCGYSITLTGQNYASDGLNASGVLEQKSLWEWTSPAIGLWLILLAINGGIGLFSHIRDISSPYWDLGAKVLSAFFILMLSITARRQLNPLLRSFGYKGFRSYFEISAALGFICVFMWAYIVLASLLGVEKLSYLADFREHGWPIWSAFIIICLFPGIFEELAFRGYIMARLEKVGNAREAVLIQAAMFSSLHMLPANFISHFVIGLILGAVRIRSGSLFPGMLIHIAWNAIVIAKEA